MSRYKSNLVLILIVLIFFVGAFLSVRKNKENQNFIIDSFDKCVTAGFPVQESFPRKCTDGIGVVFTEEIIVKDSKQSEALRVFYPTPSTRVSTPVSFSGEARGIWFKENTFSVEVRDKDGKTLAKSKVVREEDVYVDKLNYFDDLIAIPMNVSSQELMLVFINGNMNGEEVVVPINYLKK